MVVITVQSEGPEFKNNSSKVEMEVDDPLWHPHTGVCCPNVVSSLCAKVLKFCDYESSQSGEIDVLALINVAGRAVIAGEMCSPGDVPASLQMQC